MAAAVLDGLLPSSPCATSGTGRRSTLPRLPSHEPKVITREQARAIVRSAPEPYRPLVEVLAWCGLRPWEAFALRRRSIDFDARLLTISESKSLSDANGRLSFEASKNHQRRVLTLDERLLSALGQHLATHVPDTREALLFPGRTGQPLRASSFYRRVWTPALQSAGLSDVTPHALRRSVGSWLADAGVPILDIASYLGHTRAQVTLKHYARSLDDRGVRVAAAIEALRAT